MAHNRLNEREEKRDLYEVLGIGREATQDQIKSAYKKAALKHHPDKNTGPGAKEAATRFQKVSSAYVVLSDPSKKARYDAKGFAGLEPDEMDAEIDVSSLGLVGTVAAAVFSKLGVPIKTSIAASVLEAAYEGRFTAERLQFGHAAYCRAEKTRAAFLELDLTRQDIESGFIVGASSSGGSKFKLLLFEQRGDDSSWELQAQEDSSQPHRGRSVAALYFTDPRPHRIGPKPVLEAAKNPGAQLFLRLDSMAPREQLHVRPGRLLLAVYNDNWFKRAQFTVSANVLAEAVSAQRALAELRDIESELLAKRLAVRAFETEYKQAQEAWKSVCDRFAALSADVEASLMVREDAHVRLVTGGEGGAEVASPAPLFTAWPGMRRG